MLRRDIGFRGPEVIHGGRRGERRPNGAPDPPATTGGAPPAISGSSILRLTPWTTCSTLTGAAARSRWAQLLARIYEAFPLRCPECGAEMRVLAFLTDPEPTGAILRHLELPYTPPRLAPARGPPQPALEFDADPVAPADPLPADDFDQTPAFDPTDPEPVPELDLNQTPGA